MCDAPPGNGLGVCLDTMNLLTLLEDPVEATRRILPYVVTTHVKDGGIVLADGGFITFTAEAGRGIVDFRNIFAALSTLEEDIALSIEDHGGDFSIPIFDPEFLREFPDLTVAELAVPSPPRPRNSGPDEGRPVGDSSTEAKWPAACEERVKRDLKAVRALVARESREAE